MTDDVERRLAELEAMADRQRAVIEDNRERIRAQRERIERLEADVETGDGSTGEGASLLGRIGAAGVALAGLLAGATGRTAAATNQLGTSSSPLDVVATDELNGGVTGNAAVTSFTGNALQTLDSGGQTAVATPWVDADGDDVLELDADAAASSGIDVTDVEADLLRETDTLPKYSAVGDDSTATLNALQNLFAEPTWKGSGNGVHVTGPTHGEGNDAFDDAVFAPTGEVVLLPHTQDAIGLFDPSDDSYTSGPSVGTLSFGGIALAPTGDVIFAPKDDTVGIYTPSRSGTGSYQDGDTHGEGSGAFDGAALAPTGDVIFAPADSDHVGVYDPANDSYTSGPSHGEDGPQPFDGCALAATGEVIFAPKDSSNVGIYDPEADTYTSGPSQTSVNDAYSGATLAATGDVIFAPKGTNGSTGIGVYTPSESGTGSFSEGPSHGNGSDAYKGCALTPSGKVVLAPQDADTVDYYDAFARTDNARGAALHPLVNSS